MCGIFGLVTTEKAGISYNRFREIADQLFLLSESRGKESAGLALLSEDKITVYKQALPASKMILGKKYKLLFGNNNTCNTDITQRMGMIGHARLVTNGSMERNENNQPVIAGNMVGVHNGIIVNDNIIWQNHPHLHRQYEVDTEVIFALIRHYLKKLPLDRAVKETFRTIKGAASIGVFFEDADCLLLTTNTGSLYTCSSNNNSIFIFASEKYILQTVMQKYRLKKEFNQTSITQIKSGFGMIVNLKDLKIQPFSLDDSLEFLCSSPLSDKKLFTIVLGGNKNGEMPCRNTETVPTEEETLRNKLNVFIDHHKIASEVQSLKRCTRCILPETMPYIEYDKEGTCNFCRNHKKRDVLGEAALEELVSQYRNNTGEPDCIVTFSGGRDSSYGLHYIKTVLKMNPVTYSYDWGMITDLARRNQSRMCGKLGVEHILVSADIKRKRENIKRNIQAWFRNPTLGMIPLFMAGDKQYFYYANRLSKQIGTKLIVLCECPYEKTDFKSGFCGVKPNVGERSVYSIPVIDKARLAGYYAKQYLINPAYVNRSLTDTLFAFFSYYMIPHKFLKLYDYVKWDEHKINSTLISEYDWETAADTNNTWRIGDGTAPFYNYIYYIMAGFTENDTFRSNQIREGLMTREAAIALVNEENKFRYESFKWYCDTIGLDFVETIARLQQLPRLYPR